MSRKKGSEKTGGRQKGTPNKMTLEIREAYKNLIESNIDNMEVWIKTIAKNNPEKAMDLLLKLSEYVVPKLNRTEIKDLTNIETLLQMTPEQRHQRILELKKKLNETG